MPSRHVRVNEPLVVHETIDGETILIHLGTGVYYSLEGTAAEAWQLLTTGADVDEVTADLALRFGAGRGVVAPAIESFVAELLGEGLVLELGAEELPPDAPAAAGDGAPDPPTAPFLAPTLNRYTDMQQFMLVDPIHDVEEQAGWPHVKAG